MTVLEAAMVVLRESKEPLSVQQVYDGIRQRNLYTFRAKDPKAVVSAALRKASKDESNREIDRRSDSSYAVC